MFFFVFVSHVTRCTQVQGRILAVKTLPTHSSNWTLLTCTADYSSVFYTLKKTKSTNIYQSLRPFGVVVREKEHCERAKVGRRAT